MEVPSPLSPTLPAITIHPFWGPVSADWAGFASEVRFSHPAFGPDTVRVFLGDEFDDDGEETDTAPSPAQLDEFAATYQQFLAQLAQRVAEVQQSAFDRYQRLYAHYYENEAESEAPPLGIATVAQHNPYLDALKYLRVSAEATLRLSFDYDLDEEHGLEFRFTDGELAEVGGIAET